MFRDGDEKACCDFRVCHYKSREELQLQQNMATTHLAVHLYSHDYGDLEGSLWLPQIPTFHLKILFYSFLNQKWFSHYGILFLQTALPVTFTPVQQCRVILLKQSPSSDCRSPMFACSKYVHPRLWNLASLRLSIHNLTSWERINLTVSARLYLSLLSMAA